MINTKHRRGQTVRIGALAVDPALCVEGVGMFGKPGSGKSSLIKILSADAAWCGNSGVVLDVSNEMTAHLKLFGPPDVQVKRVDVYRKGSTGIHFADVLTCRTEWSQFADKVIPDVKGDASPHFRKAAREVLIEICHILDHFASGKFLLGDIIKVAWNRKLFSALVKLVPTARDPFAVAAGNDSARDVAATMSAVLSPLSVFAALNDRCAEKVSPLWPLQGKKRWMCLVRSDKATSTVEAIHSLIMDVVAEEALASLKNDRLWLICDEIRAYQPIKMIGEALRRGRKSNVVPVLSVHEIEGLLEVYGKMAGEEMLALLGWKVFLKISGVNTAEWVSKFLGTPEVLTDIPSRGGRERTYQRHLNIRPHVVADELRHSLREASWENDRIEGFIDCPFITSSFDCRFRKDIEGTVDDNAPRVSPKDQNLGPMTLDDVQRLKFPQTEEVLKSLLK